MGIVILNYLNYKDTIECIDSIMNQTESNYKIAVVDNASNNESYQILKSRYESEKNIDVICTTENLGFAQGNNFGILYLRQQYNIDNILICNNDLIFDDVRYIEKLQNVEVNDRVAILGTKIIGKDGINQNPNKDNLTFLGQVNSYVRTCVGLKYKENKLYSMIKKRKISEIEQINKHSLSKGKSILDSSTFLHGACFLLTDNFFKYYPMLYPETFLYYEENILKILMNKQGLLMEYIDDFSVFHKEDQSSALSFDNNNKKLWEFHKNSRRKGILLLFYSNKKINKIFARQQENLAKQLGINIISSLN